MQTKDFYTTVVTENFDESVKFYTDCLGFTVKHELTLPTGHVAVIENGSGAKIEIMEIKKSVNIGLEMKIGLSSIRTNVDNLDEAEAEFKSKGYKIITGQVNITTGKAMIVEDPNGVKITVMQHIDKK